MLQLPRVMFWRWMVGFKDEEGITEVERRIKMKGESVCKLFLRDPSVSSCANLNTDSSLLPALLLHRRTTGLGQRRMAKIPALDAPYYTRHNRGQCDNIPSTPLNAPREPRHDTPLR
jgi:hypothetical protein